MPNPPPSNVAGPRPLRIKRQPAAWEHRLGEPVPSSIPLADASVDEVRLRGSMNLPLPEETQRRRLVEGGAGAAAGRKALRPRADRRPPAEGGAGASGPGRRGTARPLGSRSRCGCWKSAGFEDVRLLQLDAKPCFIRDGVEMRETQLEG